MKMTADFAQAVAATAPLILLVGVVEMRMYAQMLRQQHEDDERGSASLRAELAADPDEERQAEIRVELRSRVRRSYIQAALPMGVSVFWVLISIVLATVTYAALDYLAAGAPEGAPGLARWMLTSIMLGMIMLLAIPVATWFNAYFWVPLRAFRELVRERADSQRRGADDASDAAGR
ncbi:hypothetical protein ABZ837_29160 [Streptomyces sp. NPDC047197]|uniref:hypothetical protein n=1 Tax=Streptomyces sp. NPDC047197 TaxID=3155477 RepID=UPI00340A0787